ncbi:MAG: PhoU domain-containing protein [Microthrixaceae bacterium]
MSFFRGDGGVTDTVDRQVTEMLGACRHSFDLAMSALVAGEDIEAIGDDVRDTDQQINGLEETVRRELVVHAAVHDSADMSLVLPSLLVVKRLERVGDQCKNIFDLAERGVRFTDAPDRDMFDEDRRAISTMFADTIEMLSERDETDVEEFSAAAEERMATLDDRVYQLLNSAEPSSFGVPRAMLARYLKRIVANLEGSARTVTVSLTGSEPTDLDE